MLLLLSFLLSSDLESEEETPNLKFPEPVGNLNPPVTVLDDADSDAMPNLKLLCSPNLKLPVLPNV